MARPRRVGALLLLLSSPSSLGAALADDASVRPPTETNPGQRVKSKAPLRVLRSGNATTQTKAVPPCLAEFDAHCPSFRSGPWLAMSECLHKSWDDLSGECRLYVALADHCDMPTVRTLCPRLRGIADTPACLSKARDDREKSDPWILGLGPHCLIAIGAAPNKDGVRAELR